MLLPKAFKGTKIIETIDNYIIAENYTIAEKSTHDNCLIEENELWFYKDNEFWSRIIKNPEQFWSKSLNLYCFVISDWVARIPGLYWTNYSSEIRKHADSDVAIRSDKWLEFNPPGKSKKILGGIGTMLLPPNDDGKRIVTVSSSCNASLGIPLLIFPDVWDALSLKQGDAVNIRNAKWQPLDISWAKRFASTNEIPRGYLIIDNENKIEIIKRDTPIVYHPFSIMEYQVEDALLYDFVYLTIDSKVKNGKKRAHVFFENYALKDNRNGRYLLNPNMVEPLFEAQYMSPIEMQQPTQRAQLDLLYRRVKGAFFDKTTLDSLIQLIPKYYDSGLTIRRLARSIGVSPSIFQDDNAASQSIQLIDYCMNTNKIEELTDRMMVEYPQIFK